MPLFKSLVILILLFGVYSPVQAADRLVFEGDSPYTGIQVYDKDDGLRYMQFGTYEQTAMRLN